MTPFFFQSPDEKDISYMSRYSLPLVLCSLLFLPACAPKANTAERWPGFESAPADSLATLRESDSIYILGIDGVDAPPGPIFFDTYHQYQILAGTHTLAIQYYNGNSKSGILRPVVALQPGHTYSFQA